MCSKFPYNLIGINVVVLFLIKSYLICRDISIQWRIYIWQKVCKIIMHMIIGKSAKSNEINWEIILTFLIQQNLFSTLSGCVKGVNLMLFSDSSLYGMRFETELDLLLW